MDTKTSNFQIAALIIFALFMILGILLFSTSKLKQGAEVLNTPVVMWGTLSSELMNRYIDKVNTDKKDSLQITYVQKDSKTYEKSLIEAIADDRGPDIAIISEDMIMRNYNKFLHVPYETYPIRNFKDQFIDSSSIFLLSSGILAIPFAVDPIVMYFNKTHFVNAGIINPPTDWNLFIKDVAKLTKKDSNFNITQSGTAFGEYQNVNHSRDILSMLFMQAGVPIVSKLPDDSYKSVINLGSKGSDRPLSVTALYFYTDFANPTKETYSWNKFFKSSLDSFISGDLSIYFGFASELPLISSKNPNLNFDVAPVPQIPEIVKKSTFAKIYGMGVLKSSKNQSSAFNQVITMTSKDGISALSEITNLPPIRKDVLSSNSSSNLYTQIFNDSALIADTWVDPKAEDTELIFKKMIETVINGSMSPDGAVGIAEGELQNLIINNTKQK